MPWWGWLILGALLLSAEMFAIDAQFYLVFVGVGALIVGIGQVAGIDVPMWAQWLFFAAISLAFMFTVRRPLYDKIRSRAVGVVNTAVGGRIVLAEALEPGQYCRAEFRGTMWTAVNVGEDVIPAGKQAHIDAVDGLTLKVKASH